MSNEKEEEDLRKKRLEGVGEAPRDSEFGIGQGSVEIEKQVHDSSGCRMPSAGPWLPAGRQAPSVSGRT